MTQRMRLIAYVTGKGEVLPCDDVGTNTFAHHYVHAPERMRFLIVEEADLFMAIDLRETMFPTLASETGWNKQILPDPDTPTFSDPAAAIMSAVLKAMDNG